MKPWLVQRASLLARHGSRSGINTPCLNMPLLQAKDITGDLFRYGWISSSLFIFLAGQDRKRSRLTSLTRFSRPVRERVVFRRITFDSLQLHRSSLPLHTMLPQREGCLQSLLFLLLALLPSLVLTPSITRLLVPPAPTPLPPLSSPAPSPGSGRPPSGH